MRSIPTETNPRAKGFTLVEMLVVAPLVLIVVSTFIALMVALVNDVLLMRDQNIITYDSKEALDRIEQDAHLSSKFLSSTGALTTPQGSDNNYTGSASFSNASNTLIFSEPATDENPLSPTRSLIYYAYQPNACGFNETFNRIFTIKVVYFIKNGSLWRRTLVPDYNTNSTNPDANTICNKVTFDRPWARNSCSPGYTAPRCETNDEEVMKNIVSMNTKYYSDPSSTTDLGAANAENASAINVTITSQKTTAGHTFTTTDSLLANKINSLDTDVPAPNTPVITHSMPRPDKVTFSWTAIPEIVSYSMSYNINGGAWVNQSLTNDTTSYTIDANRGDTVTFKLTAVSTTQSSAQASDVATMDLWTDLNLQNGWSIYSTTSYSSPQFTKSPDGTVFLKGLIKGGSTTRNDVIATLPVGYRPAGRLIFQTSTYDYTSGRIDVDTDGSIRFYAGSNTYIALDGIAFLPSSSPYTWRGVTFSNGWSNLSGYEPLHATIDGMGRGHVQGTVTGGTTAHNTVMAQPTNSSGLIPPDAVHFPAGNTVWGDFWVWDGASEYTKRGSGALTYMGLQGIYYPGTSSGDGWKTPPWSNGWGNYGNGFPTLQYTKASDKVVTVRGVVSGGSVSRNIVIATLPVGYRPVERQLFTVVAASDVYGRIDVDTDGTIRLVEGNGTWDTVNFSFITN